MADKVPSLEELLIAIGFPVEDAKKKLEQLAIDHPGVAVPAHEAEWLISQLFSPTHLAEFKKIAADELLTLVRTGKSDISQNTDDTGLV